MDCHDLSYAISRRLGTTLSFNTLRRFFNLMKALNQPSNYTLNTLAVYCGYSSYDAFIHARKKIVKEQKEEDPGVLPYLILLFKNTEVCDRNDTTYANLVYQTISYLNNYTHLANAFQHEIAKTKNGQNFYFEKFINIDKLNSIYGRGLQYYAREKKTKEAQIFAYSLLCFRSFLSNDDAGVKMHYSTVMQHDKDTTTINPCFLGHFYATQLYYAFVTGESPEPALVKACKFYASIANTKNKDDAFFYFELTMACALILTEQYGESLFYSDAALKKRKSYTHSLLEAQLLENFEVFRATALAHTGNVTEAKMVFEKIDTSRFCPLFKQFLTIMYLNLKQYIRKSNTEQAQVQYLVQETGFQRLLNTDKSNETTKSIEEQPIETMGRLGQKNKKEYIYIRTSNHPSETNGLLVDTEPNGNKSS